MTFGFNLLGLSISAIGAAGGTLTLIYWWVKFHPESHFSQEVKRLFAVYLLTVEPEKVLDEVVDPPGSTYETGAGIEAPEEACLRRSHRDARRDLHHCCSLPRQGAASCSRRGVDARSFAR